MPLDHGGIGQNRQFPTTSWSLIFNGQSSSQRDYARQMARLAEIYWRPVYSFIRHSWGKSHEDAKDLTQEFFVSEIFGRNIIDGYAPARGGFRAYLRGAISHFMTHALDRESTKKRGGGLVIASLDALGVVVFESLRDDTSLTPEQMFDIAWREAVVTEAMELLEAQLIAEGRGTEFEVFKRYDYEGDSAEMSYDDLADTVAMTAPQVRRALANARKRFRKIVSGIVGSYVDDPAELAAEFRALFRP